MSVVSMRELLEAGVHFGHQTRRWNPKMRRFIFTERGGIYIIDLQQTLALLEQAHAFVRNIAERGGAVLFVGTKKQAQDAVAEQAARVGMPYVNHRWLGGLLTNWRTMSERIERLHELRRLREDGSLEKLPSKERLDMLAELEKLETNLGGVADMKRLPDAILLIDLRKEQLAVREARRLGIPVIGLVDTNCDPDDADFVIPGNDDAIRACSLIVRVVADGVAAGGRRVDISELTGGNGQPEAADGESGAPAEEPAAAAAPAAEPADEAPAEEPPAAAAEEPADEAPAEEPPPAQEPAIEEPVSEAGEAEAAGGEPEAPAEPVTEER
jgi:small subunit ribosomal protein S2